MQDLVPVIIAVCGLSTVCVGLLLVGAYVIARFTGTNFIAPILAVLLHRGSEGDEAPAQPAPARRPGARPSADLRARAKSLDFDSALAKYRQEGSPPTGKPTAKPPSRAARRGRPPVDDDQEEESGSLRRRRRSLEDDRAIYDDDDGFL